MACQLQSLLLVTGFIASLVVAQPPNTPPYVTCNSTMPCPQGLSCLQSNPCKLGLCAVCTQQGYRMDTSAIPFVNCTKPTVKVNDTCTMDAQCLGINTICSPNSKCVCTNPAFVPLTDGSDCAAPPGPLQLGVACSDPTQCSMFNAQCSVHNSSSSICHCLPGYKHDVNNVDCIPLVPGDTCTYWDKTACDNTTGVCVNAACDSSGKFACLQGYHYVTSETVGFTPGCYNTSVNANQDIGQACSAASLQLCKPPPASGSSTLPLACSVCPEAPANFICVQNPTDKQPGNTVSSATKTGSISATVTALALAGVYCILL